VSPSLGLLTSRVARLRKGLAPFGPASPKLGFGRGQSDVVAESSGCSGARRGVAAMQRLDRRERLRSPSFRESDVHCGVPAHRSYVAEYWWVAFRLHISSRHALQKQRQTGVNGGLAGRVSGSNPRGAAGEATSESHAEAAKGLHVTRNPGWRHERHSAVFFLERGWRSRASLGGSSEDLTSGTGTHEGFSSVEGALDRRNRFSSRSGGKSGLGGGRSVVLAREKGGRLSSGNYDGSVRGEIASSPWEDNARATRRKSDFRRGEHAPMTIHQSEYGVVKRFIFSRVEPRSAQTQCGEYNPPRNARDAGTRYGSLVGRSRSVSS